MKIRTQPVARTSNRSLVGATRAGLVRRGVVRLRTIGELLGALGRGGRWWLVPLTVVLLGAAVLLAVVHAVEYVAPFVYTVF